jgi:hypothetical protein
MILTTARRITSLPQTSQALLALRFLAQLAQLRYRTWQLRRAPVTHHRSHSSSWTIPLHWVVAVFRDEDSAIDSRFVRVTIRVTSFLGVWFTLLFI